MLMEKKQTMANKVSHFRHYFLERKVEFAIILFYVGYIAVIAYCLLNGFELPEITGFE